MSARQLWNDDILHDILEYLAPASFPSLKCDNSGLSALARCARSSKALFRPATQVLWRQVDLLSIFTGILAPVCQKVDDKDGKSTYVCGLSLA